MTDKIGQIAALTAEIWQYDEPRTAEEAVQLAGIYAALYNFTSMIPLDTEHYNLPHNHKIREKANTLFEQIQRRIELPQPQNQEQITEQAKYIHALFTINQQVCLIPDPAQEEICYNAAENLIDEIFNQDSEDLVTTKYNYTPATTLALCNLIADYFNPIDTTDSNPLIRWYNNNRTIKNNTLPDSLPPISPLPAPLPLTQLRHQLESLCEEAAEELQMKYVA